MGFFGSPSDHPDALTFDIAGNEIPWLLNKQAFEIAEEEGVDFEEMGKVEEGDVIANLDALVTLLYVGTIPFREAGEDLPTREDFDFVLTPAVAARVGPKIMKQYQGITDEEIEAAVGKE